MRDWGIKDFNRDLNPLLVKLEKGMCENNVAPEFAEQILEVVKLRAWLQLGSALGRLHGFGAGNGERARAIRTSQLHALLRFHLWPINVVVDHHFGDVEQGFAEADVVVSPAETDRLVSLVASRPHASLVL